MIDDAIRKHADLNVDLPAGPPRHLFGGCPEFRAALTAAGFDGESMTFERHLVH